METTKYLTMNVSTAMSTNMVAEPATEMAVAASNDRQFLDFDVSKVQTLTLNQAQIGRITEKMMLAYHNNGKVTAWDFYNAATDMYKSATLDQPMILSQNLAMVDFLDKNIL